MEIIQIMMEYLDVINWSKSKISCAV